MCRIEGLRRSDSITASTIMHFLTVHGVSARFIFTVSAIFRRTLISGHSFRTDRSDPLLVSKSALWTGPCWIRLPASMSLTVLTKLTAQMGLLICLTSGVYAFQQKD